MPPGGGTSSAALLEGTAYERPYGQVMTVSLALLPSPLLGLSVWQPVAHILTAQGWTIATCAAPRSPRAATEVLHAFLTELPADDELVLVAHSNAGAHVPLLTTQRRVIGTVFVDAVLPPRRGHQPLAPPEILQFLREKTDARGVLPGWTEWWEEADVAALFPDRATRTRIEREQPRLSLSYFQDQLPVPADWDQVPGAYLAFGETYSHERDDAEHRRWPVTTLAGEHLHLVKEPIQVAIALTDLLQRIDITVTASRPDPAIGHGCSPASQAADDAAGARDVIDT